MGLFIICIALPILCYFIIRQAEKSFNFEWLEPIAWIVGLFSSGVFVIMLMFAMTLSTQFDYTEEKYNNLKQQLEYVEYDDVVTSENLRNQVLDMNNEISHHKCYAKNFWVGMWYSKAIGQLQPLKWKSSNKANKVIKKYDN